MKLLLKVSLSAAVLVMVASAQALQVTDPQGIVGFSDEFLGDMPYELSIREHDTMEEVERRCPVGQACYEVKTLEAVGTVTNDGYTTTSRVTLDDGRTYFYDDNFTRASYEDIRGNRLRNEIRMLSALCRSCELTFISKSLVPMTDVDGHAVEGLKIEWTLDGASQGRTSGWLVLGKGLPYLGQSMASHSESADVSSDTTRTYRKAE